MTSKKEIRDYWGQKLPQLWYSRKSAGSKRYFYEIERKRYGIYYRYLPEVAEFNQHIGDKVLEVGCGIGTDLMQYAKAGAKVVGVDLTPEAIKVTKDRFKKMNLAGRFLVADAEKLPFKSKTFDFVFSFGVIHHTPNPEKAIREIYRVLKPSGKAVVMLYARGWNHYLVRLFWRGVIKGDLFKMSYQDCINKNSEVYGGTPLTNVFSKKKIKKFFSIFPQVKITRHRFLPLFDSSHYLVGGWPKWFNQTVNQFVLLSEKLKTERILGENWIIKAKK